jgi:type I restriction enzyme S subunit
MTDWKETTLGKVAEIQTGPFGSQLHQEDYVIDGTPIITVENLVNDYINHTSDTPKVSESDRARLSRYILNEGDIVFSRVGSVDRCGYVSEKENGWLFSGRLLRIRPNKEIFNKYVFYWVSQRAIKEYVRKIAVGATMPSINTKLLSEIPISFPPINEQRAIAAILSSFDDKIELLRRQNKTLEKIAQTIFKEWFINFNFPDENGKPYKNSGGKMKPSEPDEIPHEWKVGKLKKVVELRGGTTPKTSNSDFWNGNINWTSPKDISNTRDLFLTKTERKITENGLKQISSGLLPKGTLLLSSRAPIGYLAISNIDISINQGYIALLPNTYFSNIFMYLWLKTYMQKVINAANGSTFLEISKSSFKNIDCIIPYKDVLNNFEVSAKPIFTRIRSNIYQIQTLSRLRDILLPKLMKGKIRIRGNHG